MDATSHIRRALLLVDIQYDFLPDGSLAVPLGEAILPPTYRLLDSIHWSLIVASQDHHPPSHISFASRHSGTPFTQVELPHKQQTQGSSSATGASYMQDLWPDHCVMETRGCEIEDGVKERLQILGGKVVRKGTGKDTDAYSAFAASPSSDTQQDLLSVLRDGKVDEIYVIGLATDYCVRATALDALAAKEWKVFVVREAVKGVSTTASDETLVELEKAGASVVSIDGPEMKPLFI